MDPLIIIDQAVIDAIHMAIDAFRRERVSSPARLYMNPFVWPGATIPRDARHIMGLELIVDVSLDRSCFALSSADPEERMVVRMEGYHVRIARMMSDDVPRVLDMMVRLHRMFDALVDEPRLTQAIKAHLVDTGTVTQILVARAFEGVGNREAANLPPGRIVGFVHAVIKRDPPFLRRPLKAEIENLFVEPEFRHTGVAAMLMEAIEEWVRQSSVEEVELYVHRENSDAIAFYGKHGYKSTHLVMRKSLKNRT